MLSWLLKLDQPVAAAGSTCVSAPDDARGQGGGPDERRSISSAPSASGALTPRVPVPA